MTPQADSVGDAVQFVAQLRAEAEYGAIAVAQRLAAPVVGSVRQLWGRSALNLGFGAALGIDDLDDAVASLFGRLACPHGFDRGFADLGAC